MPTFKLTITIILLGTLSACASLSKSECNTANWQQIGYEDGSQGKKSTRLQAHRKACAKHNVTPNSEDYDQGYQKGIKVYCTYDKGLLAGKRGRNTNAVCPADTDYQTGYQEGLNLFCSNSKGIKDAERGYKAHGLCLSNPNYNKGYEYGLSNYCTYDNGFDLGFSNKTYNSICPSFLEEEFLDGYDLGNQVGQLERDKNKLIHDLNSIESEQRRNDEKISDIQGRLKYDKDLTSTQRKRLWNQLNSYRNAQRQLAREYDDKEHELDDIRSELRELNFSRR